MSSEIRRLYEFGSFWLDAAARTLTHDGEPVPLAPKTFDLLALMVESEGQLLSKSELMHALWDEAFVEEGNLTYQVSTLRKALGAEVGISVPSAGCESGGFQHCRSGSGCEPSHCRIWLAGAGLCSEMASPWLRNHSCPPGNVPVAGEGCFWSEAGSAGAESLDDLSRFGSESELFSGREPCGFSVEWSGQRQRRHLRDVDRRG